MQINCVIFLSKFPFIFSNWIQKFYFGRNQKYLWKCLFSKNLHRVMQLQKTLSFFPPYLQIWERIINPFWGCHIVYLGFTPKWTLLQTDPDPNTNHLSYTTMDAAIVAGPKKILKYQANFTMGKCIKKVSKAACCKLLSTIDTHIGFIAFQFRGQSSLLKIHTWRKPFFAQ